MLCFKDKRNSNVENNETTTSILVYLKFLKAISAAMRRDYAQKQHIRYAHLYFLCFRRRKKNY